MKETVFTYCQICEQACGLKVTREDDQIVRIEPDKEHVHSWRDFCIKGARAGQVARHPNRLRAPMQRVGDQYVERSYDEAIADISTRLGAIVQESGPSAVASYAGNPNGMDFGGSLFLSLFMDAIGSHNRYWVSSIDQNALHYVAERMYGHAFATLQLDIDHCEFLLLIGANPAVSGMCWIGYAADGWNRLLRRQAEGATRIVVVDPRRTESARKAKTHIAINPEQDWALLLGMIKVIFAEDWSHAEDCRAAQNVGALKALAEESDLEDLAGRCDVPVCQIVELAREFAAASGAAVVARTGSAIGVNGSLTEWLSHALNLITGNTDRAGGRFYNPGLVDPLVAGDRIFRPNRVRSRVRGLDTVAGYHAIAELPDEIETKGESQIRALIISAGNPVVSGPDGQALDNALQKLDLLVAIDLVQRESHRHADWLIPAAHWLERAEFNPLISGLSDSPIAQMGRQVLKKPPSIRHEWEFVRDLTLALDAPLMNRRGVNTLARFSRFVARWTGNPYHGFGPAWVARYMVWQSGKARWRDLQKAQHGLRYAEREYGALRKALRERGQSIDSAPADLMSVLQQRLTTPNCSDHAFPLQVISRRRRETMNSWYGEITTRPGDAQAGSRVEIHPSTAAALSVVEGERVTVTSKTATVQAYATLCENVKANVVVMEQGWGSRVIDAATGNSQVVGVNRNLLVANDDLDPLSAVPRMNGTPVVVTKTQRER